MAEAEQGRIEVAPEELEFFSSGLNRPECVLCLADGTVATSNWAGGVSVIHPDGLVRHILGERPGREPVATNGFAIDGNGDFLLADLGGDGGGIWRLGIDGQLAPLLTEVGGTAIPPTNFVGVDRKGRIWATVSTRHKPRADAYRPDIADGFIILLDDNGARIVADGLGYTNEAIVDPGGDWLYVNETFGRRTSRFRIGDDGSLGVRETVTEYGPGTFPDGLAFDEEGHFWMTSVVSNRLIRVAPDGDQTVVLEENDPDALEVVEAAYQACEMERKHLDIIKSEVMQSISSIAFGGADRRTVFLGNLLDHRIYSFRSPVAGAEPSHWNIGLARYAGG
jgi:sugar lactone lactonase YvrE